MYSKFETDPISKPLGFFIIITIILCFSSFVCLYSSWCPFFTQNVISEADMKAFRKVYEYIIQYKDKYRKYG